MPPTRSHLRPARDWRTILPLRVLAGLAVAGTATLWGTSMAATKAALDAIQPVQLACLRFLVAGVLLCLLAQRTGSRPDLGWRATSLGLTGVVLFIGIQNLGLQSARAADATVVIGGALPAASAVLGFVILREHLEPLKFVGLLCSMAGISLVGLAMQGDETSSLLGIALLLVAAISGAAYATLGRKAYQTRNLAPLLAVSGVLTVRRPVPGASGPPGSARLRRASREPTECGPAALSWRRMLRPGIRAVGVRLAAPDSTPERADLQSGNSRGAPHGHAPGRAP